MKNKKKSIIITCICCVSVLVLITVLLLHFLYYSFTFSTDDGTKINNNSDVEVVFGQKDLPNIKAIYKDYTDNSDGTEVEVTKSGDADLSKIGTYPVTYTANYNGKSKSIDVNIKVVDKTGPEIKLKGGNEIHWRLGKEFKDPGFTAVDDVDGDVTANVTVEGNVDINAEGTYTLTYKAKDSSGNETTVERKVTVEQKKEPVVTDPSDKVVYLTFDDGPGPYTQKLLDILDKYNVKATFFVTHGYPNYENLIGEEARRGHTVAVHSYTHKYDQIYRSVDAFFEDFNKMNDVVKAQTGQEATILRFPGGSSNTVSRKYCPGVMTALTNEMNNRGILYADWNVSSGDAGETTSTQQVITNVINGIQKNHVSTILQHDIKDFSVNAVEQIIQWGKSNGYTFLPLTEHSPMFHQPVAN